MSPTNALSFDLEHWFTATLLREETTDPVVHVERSTEIVLDLLDRHDVTATFYVVGEVAEAYPDLIARIATAGHEIGSHGHTHRPLFELTPEIFREELDHSSDALEAAVNERPRGFRAPNFSVTPRTEWAFETLTDAGFEYDSSVFPVKTPMYGVRGAPLRPYAVNLDAPFAAGGPPRPDALTEVPLAVFHPHVRLPIAGGFYARVLPARVVKWGIKTFNASGTPATLYFHPWEFNPAVADELGDVSPHARFISSHGIDTLAAKLDSLLEAVEFGPVEDVIDEATTCSTERGVTPSEGVGQ
ncbi:MULTISPECIES: polysaccharide deacetylase family protein [Halococcus]|uniref:Putative polysaccharide deacetylase n=1 Tax=Halococcus salifodinae DSM 8989 TaxID=1227456 RepID=M0N7F1_9EURY|nr:MULTISPECIES: polysaccharide deacetylase family protein [Halococcus]EMA53039.1 putative polysaccharide deacetylase [Halococcus salifodinae DSM 8989]